MTTDRTGNEPNRLCARAPHQDTQPDHYYVELPLEMLDDQGSLLDSVICYTFDTLHVQHLDLRIIPDLRSSY